MSAIKRVLTGDIEPFYEGLIDVDGTVNAVNFAAESTINIRLETGLVDMAEAISSPGSEHVLITFRMGRASGSQSEGATVFGFYGSDGYANNVYAISLNSSFEAGIWHDGTFTTGSNVLATNTLRTFALEIEFGAAGFMRLYEDGVMSTPTAVIGPVDLTTAGATPSLGGLVMTAGNRNLYLRDVVVWDLNDPNASGSLNDYASIRSNYTRAQTLGTYTTMALSVAGDIDLDTFLDAVDMPYDPANFALGTAPAQIATFGMDGIDPGIAKVFGIQYGAFVQRNGTTAGANIRFWSKDGANERQTADQPAPGDGFIMAVEETHPDGTLYINKGGAAGINPVELGFETRS